ncbi:MAG: sigma 54-interacting transcriptional regulator [Candidatus Schekmanbacteria bacterium]|nr:sigma 54-interacting transcriptional regulator [Candidatus Schekmanbacteria bacterium]
MPLNAPIFNYQEQTVLLHVLFAEHSTARKSLEDLILKLERADYDQPLTVEGADQGKLIDLFLGDKEFLFPDLKNNYNIYGFKTPKLSKKENALLEAGIFYTISKLLLIKCYFRKGLNKLMYTSVIPGIPDKFRPLYLYRLGVIYLEQGMMAEASDILELAIQRCRKFDADTVMQTLEKLIFYQILRVYVIHENFAKAEEIIKNLNEKVSAEDDITFISLLGYYYRTKQEYDKAFAILDRAYTLYKSKDQDKVKYKFPRQWFNTLYQLAFCCLEKEEFSRAEVIIQEAKAGLSDLDYRNHGYCENLLGQLEMAKKGGEPSAALQHFQTAYSNFGQYTDYRNMARSLRSIGKVYFKLKDYPKAIQAYDQSLAYDYRTQIQVGILKTLLAKVELYIELVQYNQVAGCLKQIADLKIPQDHYLQKEVKKYEQTLEENRTPADKLIGNSKAMSEIKEKILECSKWNDPVLIVGESGVGKNMVAEAVHKDSNRSGKLVHIECTRITSTLTESELFGYEKGAFTGAANTKKGPLEDANGGTAFLDEIGDLPLELQGKLLHFFDKQNTIRRVGGTQDIKLDVMVICATNKELEKEVAKGNFRKDLYHRILDSLIEVPPLRERKEDIKELAKFFYVKYCTQFNRDICGIKEDALNYIQEYEWPGNVRELEKTIKRSVRGLKSGLQLSRENLEQAIIPQEKPQAQISSPHENLDDLKNQMQDLAKRLEKLENHPSDKRLSNSKNVLNELFLLIQQENPIRKSKIVERCPHLKKSFHHWIDALVDKYGVIEVEKHNTYQLYRPVAAAMLKEKVKAGMIKEEGGYFKLG